MTSHCLSFNQTVQFFNRHYLRRNSIDILVLGNGDDHQGKFASEMTTMVRYCQVRFLTNQIAGLFDQQYN